MSIKRTNSEIFIREIYPPILESLALDMETEVSKIFYEKSKTDKRYLGSLVCAGVVIFFLVVLGITFFFVFIPAIIVALCLGHVIGKR